MSKRARRWLIAVGVVVLGGVGMAWAMRDKSPGDGVAVVELFTSEGCSSCPPADALLGRLVKEGHERVYLLAFHVDYWDTPAWRDAFSDARFSRRQQAYAKASRSREVYTPQMIVNGGEGFVGSDEAVARKEIAAAIRRKAPVPVSVSAKVVDGEVVAECSTDAAGIGKVLNVAIVQRGIQRKIGGGENAGRSLSHQNVVRAFESVKTVEPKSSLKLKLPTDAAVDQCSVIAFVQDDAMHVLGAGAVDLAPVRK
jgi:hypothetical protein